MDIRSKPTFVPCGHHLLFTFSLVCLFAHLLSSWLLCLPCLSCFSTLCLSICSLHLFLPLLICWFLIFAFACTRMKRRRLELGHSLPRANKKGTDESMWHKIRHARCTNQRESKQTNKHTINKQDSKWKVVSMRDKCRFGSDVHDFILLKHGQHTSKQDSFMDM